MGAKVRGPLRRPAWHPRRLERGRAGQLQVPLAQPKPVQHSEFWVQVLPIWPQLQLPNSQLPVQQSLARGGALQVIPGLEHPVHT